MYSTKDITMLYTPKKKPLPEGSGYRYQKKSGQADTTERPDSVCFNSAIFSVKNQSAWFSLMFRSRAFTGRVVVLLIRPLPPLVIPLRPPRMIFSWTYVKYSFMWSRCWVRRALPSF